MSVTGVFEKFKLLRTNMEINGWVIEAFNFKYKNIEYVVLAKLYQGKKPKYALLETEIIKLNDCKESKIIPVNSNGFMTDAMTLRNFFGIDYAKNLGNILDQFNQYFSKFIPTEVNLKKTKEIKEIMIRSLSKSDSENPNKIYCFSVRRNPNNGRRTLYNDNKTKLLRPNLYFKLKDEQTISFCYSENMNDEQTDEEILLRFSEKS